MYALEGTTIMGRFSEQLDISIGRVPLRLHISNPSLYAGARKRYAEFLELPLDPLPVFVGAGEDPPRQASTNPEGQFTYQWEGSSLALNTAAAYFEGVRHEYGLDSLIRILLSVLLASERGFLLHAATVVRNGGAYVFTGKSGAGKSTVASLSPSGSVLTDEISLLRFMEGAWHAFGTPFWGEFRAEGANIRVPIVGVYVLSQASENRIEHLSASAVLRSILPNILFFSREPEVTRKLLRLLTEFIVAVPCYRLSFRKDPDFWRLLAA